MKKIYLSALALSIASLSFGQKARTALPERVAEPIQSSKQLNIDPQDKGITLWSDDFSSIATWNLTNTSVPAQDWIYTTDLNAVPTFTTPVNFTTGANGYLYIDSDDLGATTQNITAETVTPIDLTGEPNVTLFWDQEIVSYNEIFTVGVSNDNGVSWTDFIIDGAGGQTRLFESKSINISAVAGGSSQVLIRFNYQGAFDWMWAIDDVRIEKQDLNDLKMSDAYYGTAVYPYSRIPVNQIQPIEFTAKILNDGLVDQTNTILTADVNSGTFTTVSPAQTVVSGATDSLVAATWTPPTTTGVPYTITLSVASDSTDATPGDNTESFAPLEITTNVYAYDDYSSTPGAVGGDIASSGAFEFEAGNNFDIFVADDLYAIDVVIGTGTPDATNIEGVLYENTSTGFVKIAASTFHSTTIAEIGTVVHLLFPTHPTLTVGKTYFAAVHSIATEFYYGTSGSSPSGAGTAGQTSLRFYPTMANPNAGQNFYTTSTPMVRMNFDNTLVGLEELNKEDSFNVFPNPSNGVFNISISSNNNVNLTVKNVVGQTILTETVNVSGKTNHTISLADYSKGVYFLTVGNETVKLIVE